MTQLQELTKKIQAHCPELMDLRFGCEVEVRLLPNPSKTIHKLVADFSGNLKKNGLPKSDSFFEVHEFGGLGGECMTSIIGHPITLEHVLRAIAKSTLEYIRVTATQTESVGMIVAIDIGSGREFWTLGLPLHLQSEPLINWLNTIIK